MKKEIQLSVVLSAFTMLSACTPQVAKWTPAETPKQNQVQRIVHEHYIKMPAHDPKLSKAEKKALHSFLTKNVSNPYAVTAYLEEYGGHSDERVKAVKSVLRDYGIRKDHIIVDEMDIKEAGMGSGLRLVVEGFVAIPPNCMNWTEELGEAKGAYTHSNFGCADAINLGMMVSDPRDLVVGRETGAYDGTRHALDVKMYQEDKVKALKVEQVGSDSSSGGGSSGGSGAN